MIPLCVVVILRPTQMRRQARGFERDVCTRVKSRRAWQTARGDEARSVAEKKIPHVVSAMILVDDGTLRIVAHPAGAEQVHAATRRARRGAPGFLRARSLHDLERAILQEFRRREIVGMILV